MSRRCRASLQQRAGGSAADHDLSSGCECARLGGGKLVIPCTEPTLYGSNILFDSGFETHLATTGGGPDGDEIPFEINSLGVTTPPQTYGWWTDDSRPLRSAWVQQGSPVSTPWNIGWRISSADPHTGAFHARLDYTGPNTRSLIPIQFPICFTHYDAMTARVGAGDLISLSFWMKGVSTTGTTPNVRTFYTRRAANYSNTVTPNTFVLHDDIPLNGSYTQYTHSWFVPIIDAAYARYVIGAPRVPAGQTQIGSVDLDDVQVALLQADQGVLLCSQSGLITIDNDTTETAFL